MSNLRFRRRERLTPLHVVMFGSPGPVLRDPEPSSSQPSKSALKKAQKLARNEKRQLAKKEKSVTSSSSPSSDIQHQQEQKSVHLPDEDKIINENLCSLPIPASEDALLEEEETYDDLTDGHLQGALSYPTTGATTPDYPPEESKSSAESQAALNPEAEKAKKIQNAVTRTTWGFAMVAGFISTSPLISSDVAISDAIP